MKSLELNQDSVDSLGDRERITFAESFDPPREGQVLFEREWGTYRRMVHNNYLFHREAYNSLRQVLLVDAPTPFQFLDVACGDASSSIQALWGTKVQSYCGIDLSGPALGLAQSNLAVLDCPARLIQGDLRGVLSQWRSPIDVGWIGLSLHHFLAPVKLQILRLIQTNLSSRGFLVIYENAGPDNEDRASWLERWDRQRSAWTEYSDDEWNAVTAHVHAHDFPETGGRWLELGREAGFAETREIYRAPTDLFRMYILHK
jgi:hypothetical protein